MKYINEKEIHWIELNPTKGIEMKKMRPCLVLKRFSQRHFVVIPLSSAKKPEYVSFFSNTISFLEKENTWFVLSQIRVVDKSRFQERLGKISDSLFLQIKKKMIQVFELESS